jgi:hypothetical protein
MGKAKPTWLWVMGAVGGAVFAVRGAVRYLRGGDTIDLAAAFVLGALTVVLIVQWVRSANKSRP